ncbi:MAG: hypothetical protein R6V01_09870 [Thermoplasmatota archaeon]
MEEGSNITEWFGRIGIGLGGAGLLFILLPFVCLVSPILSQAAIILGMIAYVNSNRLDIKRIQWMGLVAMIIGLVGLIIQALLYVLGISIW